MRTETQALAAATMLLASLGACATAPTPAPPPACPDWTRGAPPTSYATGQLLVGLGIVPNVWDPARAEEAGRTAAMADIAKQLWVDVASESFVAMWDDSETGAGMKVHDEAYLSTRVRLWGGKVVDRCFDASTATFYTLALVEKRALAERLLADLEETNKTGLEHLAAEERLEQDGQLIEAAVRAEQALDAALAAEGLVASLRAVSGASEARPFASSHACRETLERVRSRALVRVQVRDVTGAIRQGVRKAISNTGAHLEGPGGSRGSRPVLLVRVLVDELSATRSRSLHAWVVEVQASIEVQRIDSGSVVGAERLVYKGGGPNRGTAREAAERGLAARLDEPVARLLGRAMHPSNLEISSTRTQ